LDPWIAGAVLNGRLRTRHWSHLDSRHPEAIPIFRYFNPAGASEYVCEVVSYVVLHFARHPQSVMDVIVVDDEYPLRAALRRALALEGYGVTEAASGEEAIELLRDRTWDAMILDVLMPGLSGLEVCERLRAAGERIPILMLTARETVADRVRGLEAGADDYLVKPFALEELLARLRALLRRSTPADEEEETLRYEGLVLDPVRYEARVGEREMELTRTEFSLLHLLIRHQGKVLSRTTINEQVWGYDFGPDSNSLGVYVGYLRRKLEAGGEPRLIQTVRGVGYVLRRPRS